MRNAINLLWAAVILMMTLKIPPLQGAGGAIAYALTSYYIIIILAGHYYKVNTLALIPAVFAGVILCFRKKYLWGFVITSFFMAMMIIMIELSTNNKMMGV